MDLIREPLLDIDDGVDGFDYDEFDGESNYLDYQFIQLDDAGFTDVQFLDSSCAVNKITWRGHDFLDSIRYPEIWKQRRTVLLRAGSP